MIDFGLGKKFMSSKGKHVEFRIGRSMTGTARYASINAHMGYEQSRRDDLEAIGYMMVYLVKGKLPWCGLKAKNVKEKYEKIEKVKVDTSVAVLTKGLPDEFCEYMSYVRGLRFEEKPDYRMLRKKFKDLAVELGLCDSEYDWIYDWVEAKLGVRQQVKDMENNMDGNEGNEF